jgi:MFS family permease
MSDTKLFGDGRRPVLIALMSVIAIVSYNNLSSAAALPDIGEDLGGISLLPFVITLELLTSAVAVLAAGPIVDGIGARRTFRVAVTGFIITSALVAFSPTMWVLLGARAIQGLFAGAIMTVGVASIGLAIPLALRPKAFALTSSIWGVMGVGGPAIAAVMIATVGWRGIFLVNIPVTVGAAVLGWNRIPDRTHDAEDQGFDRRGLALMSILTAAALAIASYQPVIIAIAATVVLISGWSYRRHSRRVDNPVVRIPHLVHRRYRLVHLASVLVLAGGVGANSFLPLYLGTVRGQSAGLAAFGVLFLTVGWSISSYISSRLQERWSGEWVSALGVAITVPALWATGIVIQFELAIIAVYSVFFWLGAGLGMVTSTGAALLQSRTLASEMGRLNAAHQFLRTMAITFGIAVVGAITLAIVDARTGDVEIVRDVLSGDGVVVSAEVFDSIGDAYSIAVFVMAVITTAAVPVAVGLVRTRGQRVASAP